jgi:hypothetical protein
MVNTNPETGMRYGLVALNNLQEWVFDEFFHHGKNVSYEEALKEWREENPKADEEEFSDLYEGEEENYELETETDFTGANGKTEKRPLKLGLSYLGGAPLVWVFESPYTTRARLCSPCCPNAGDLDNQDPHGLVCYTLPPDWFPSDKE